jgi:hypothetical protein
MIANRYKLTESFPSPASGAPLAQTTANAASDVATRGDERDARRLIQRFQATNDGQQFEAASTRTWFNIFGRQNPLVCDRLQDESPVVATPAFTDSIGEEQEVGASSLHCGGGLFGGGFVRRLRLEGRGHRSRQYQAPPVGELLAHVQCKPGEVS